MIEPKAIKYTCKTCGYTRTHQAKSDALSIEDLRVRICPKCHIHMEAKEAQGLVSMAQQFLKRLQK